MSEKYTDNQVEDIRKNINILDVISKFVVLDKKGKTYFGECPFCKDDGTHFAVDEDRQMYYCFRCGAGGNVFTFVKDIKKHESFMQAVEEVKSMSYFQESFGILKEIFPNCTDEEHRRIFSSIQRLLHLKVMELTKNKSYISYRDNGRFLKEFKFICEFIKSEQDTKEDVFE